MPTLRHPRAALAVAVVFATQALLLGVYYPKWSGDNPEAILTWDVAGYYMYLPAQFVYHDLAGDSWQPVVDSLYNADPSGGSTFAHASGAEVMKYPLGQALQFAPFFAVAHAFAKTSSTYPADGFSTPYEVAIAVECLLVALLGLLLLRSLLLRYFKDDVVAWTILGVGVGTNYLEYSSLTGAMPHNNLFVLYTALALVADRFYRNPSFTKAAAIGAIIGLATLSRPTELLMALLPILWGISLTREGLRTRGTFLRKHLPKLGLAALVGAVFIGLQPLYWHAVTGDWVVYSYEDQGFSFLRPHMLDGFASFRAGWITYTPMALLILAGFFALWRQPTRGYLAGGILVYTVLFSYVAWSWDIWWYGGSFGQRTMVQVYPLLAFPLAGLLSWVQAGKWWRHALVGAGFGVSILINLYWTHQAHRGGLLYVGEMTQRYYLATIGRFAPNRNRLKLLDRARIYEGARLDTLVLGQTGYENLDATYVCAAPPITGKRSLCITGGTNFTPELRLALSSDNSEGRWLRAYATVEVRQKTWEEWAMAQFVVRFVHEGEEVRQFMLRPERLLDSGRERIFFDMPVPKGMADSIVVQFWKPGGGGELLVDDVELVSYLRE